MLKEEKVQQELVNRFAYLENSLKVVRARRVSIEVSYNNFFEVFNYLVKQLNFSSLCAITGLDEGENLSFIYHLSCDCGILVNLKTGVSKVNPTIKTVIDYFPCAENYERELIDLLGARVEGLPSGNRYPLTDDWPKDQYPLRKDWKKSSLDTDKKEADNA